MRHYLVTGSMARRTSVKWLHQIIVADTPEAALNTLTVDGWRWRWPAAFWSLSTDVLAEINRAECGAPQQLSLFEVAL